MKLTNYLLLKSDVSTSALPRTESGVWKRRAEDWHELRDVASEALTNQAMTLFSSMLPLDPEVAIAVVQGSEWPWHPDLLAELPTYQVMSHEMYNVPLGAVDFETGGIVPFGALASEVYPVDLAADLVSQGRLHDAGFVIFEGCDSSVSRVLWIRGILRCLGTHPLLIGLLDIASDRARWGEAYSHRSAVSLAIHDLRKSDKVDAPHSMSVLSVVSICSKAIYNESHVDPPDYPFDRDSGWAILPSVLAVATELGPEARAELVGAMWQRPAG